MASLIEDTIKPGIQFINGIKPRDKVAIVYGHDNDTICSATIIYKLLKKLHGIESTLIVSELNSQVTESVLAGIRKSKSDHVIIVDIGTVGVEVLAELRKISDILIIDHHMPKGYVKVAYVNPRIYDKHAYIPATYLCYKLYENYSDAKDVSWIAGIGTLSDMGLKNCNDLFEGVKRDYGELVGNNRNIDEILFDKSLLGKLAKICDSGRVVGGIDGTVLALTALIKAKSYQEILDGRFDESRKLLEFHNLSEKEFNRLVNDFDKSRKQRKGIVVYEVKSKLNMKSPLATFLSRKMKNDVLVIYQKSGKYVDASFRRGGGSKVDLDELASKSVAGIPGSNSGGHIQAAGARFLVKYTNSWLKNLEKGLEQVK
ncbi:MAG: DHH family phosphoesterase [Candidatus Aenigmarchaeota archaeon]|nr:DHH family phosphoesterase [Candidatus Aenigmarchaeota archaeon]